MQPIVGVKNALQEGRAVPRTPLALYRGLLVRIFLERLDLQLALRITSFYKRSMQEALRQLRLYSLAPTIFCSLASLVMTYQQQAALEWLLRQAWHQHLSQLLLSL